MAGMTMKELGEIVKAGDVAGLEDAFNRGDWDTRETVMVAFSGLLAKPGTAARIGDRGDDPVVREQAGEALLRILALCRAEKGGGSYRENCIHTAEDWLATLGVEAPAPPPEKARHGLKELLHIGR